MSLLSRINANRCRVRDCARERAQDSDVCRADLSEKWANRLDRQTDGTYLRRAEGFVPAWRKRLTARDYTSSVLSDKAA